MHINRSESNRTQDLRNVKRKSCKAQRTASAPLTGMSPDGLVDGVFEVDFEKQVVV